LFLFIIICINSRRKVYLSPSAPKGQYNDGSEEIESSLFGYQSQASSGFRLKI